MSSQTTKLTPNLDKQSTQILNLTVLQRIDPFVEEILITAAHVTFYEFNIDLNQWSRKDVEGSLFVVKRNAKPRFQFIVMNRRNTDNLVENLLGDFEYEVQVPYLLYRNAAQEVNGIWFYNARECEDVANLFSRILNAYSKVPPKPKVSTNKSEFEELEAVPTMDVMEGPLEPTSSTSSAVADVPDDIPFMNFFSAAINLGNTQIQAPLTAPPQPPPPPPPSSHKPPVVPLPLPSLQNPPPSIHPITPPIHDSSNLVKPYSFFVPPPFSSTSPSAPPLHRPYGTPMLQPFPPPTPPSSLTPNYILSKDKVREALARVFQKDEFIEMFYQELLNAHHL